MTKSNVSYTVVWNLSGLYSGVHDPKIDRDKSEVLKLTNAFGKKYKGKINSDKLTAKALLSAINEIEVLEEKLHVYLNFASYLHSQDTKSPKIGAFYQEAMEFGTKIQTRLLWFSLEIQSIPDTQAKKLLAQITLKPYKHYLKHLRAFSPFKKTLAEEEIIANLSQVGGEAFVRFYDEKSSSEKFTYKGRVLGLAQISSIMKDDPSVQNRIDASKAYTRKFKENQKFYAYVLNTLLLEKKIIDEMRGYKYPQESTFLGYEVAPKMVQELKSTVTNSYSLCERFYHAKSKAVGRKLFEWDRYSRIYSDEDEINVSWDEAKDIVLTSFEKFDHQFADIAKMFFDKGWIDAKVSTKKRAGAFCSLGTPSKNPFILMSFTGKPDDAMTLAHELGHGIHAYLSRNNSLYNFFPSTATAEIASIFAESLVFDHLYKNALHKKQKINLLGNKIQGSMATIFRQIAFYDFESKIHEHRRQKGELSVEDFNNYFQSTLSPMFGKGLTLTDQHKYWWMPVLHFYHYNFYVFTYAFGEALTLSLYQKYKLEGGDFIEKYKKSLSKGGSLSPQGIALQMSVDISKGDSWQQGIDILSSYISEFEDLVK